MQLDLNNLQKMIDEKYISVQKHPEIDLYIYNYTQRAQFDKVWNNETMSCRGLIMDKDHNIVARPFKKFFNLEEAIAQGEQLPAEEFLVQEKFDGSLGILYWIGEKPFLATRGSFVSDQAIEGNKILEGYFDYFDDLDKNLTYLFEIIYPENRIVVDYKGRRDLILLAVIDTKTGEEKDLYTYCSGFPFASYIDSIKDLGKLKELQEDNKEGFVIRFNSGKRLKVKFDEYVRLHRLITGVNARRIWDLLRNNQPLDELLERVPDEFFDWVNKTKTDLEEKHKAIATEALETYHKIDMEMAMIFSDGAGHDYRTGNRKYFAEKAKKTKYPNLQFLILDGKPIDFIIWQMIKPKHETPFKIEI